MKEEQKKEVSSQSIEATKASETHMKSDMFKTWPQDPAALLNGKWEHLEYNRKNFWSVSWENGPSIQINTSFMIRE